MESLISENSHSNVTRNVSDGRRDHALQQDSPARVDINTGQEYRNETRPQSSTCLSEIIILKIKQENSSPSAERRCTADDCLCDQTAVFETIRKFISAIKAVAECRTHMCAFTLATLETHADFLVHFEWIELGEEFDEDDVDIVTLNSNGNNEPPTGGSSISVRLASTQVSDDDASQMLPDTSPSTTENVRIATLSPPEARPSTSTVQRSINPRSDTGRPGVSCKQSSSRKSLRKDPVLTAGLVLKTPVSRLQTVTENTEQRSASNSNAEDLASSFDIVYNCDSTENNNHLVSEEGPGSISEIQGETVSVMDKVTDNNNENISPLRPKELQKLLDLEEKAGGSSDNNKYNDDKNKNEETASVVEDSNISLSSQVNSNSSSSEVVVPELELPDKTDIPDKTDSKSNVLEANFSKKSFQRSGFCVETFPNPSDSELSSSETDSAAQPLEDSVQACVEGQITATVQPVKVKFNEGLGSARTMAMLKNVCSPSTSDSTTSEQTEKIEVKTGDSTKNDQDCHDANTTDYIHESPVIQECKTSEKQNEKQEQAIVSSNDGGVKTRSRSNGPAPASVRRIRAERAAKQNAKAKIFASHVSSSGSDTSSPAKSGGAAFSGLPKRLRSSESYSTDIQHSEASPVNKLKQKRSNDCNRNENSGGDAQVRSSPPRSSTPTLDEPRQMEPINTRRISSEVVTTSTNDDPVEDITENMPEEETQQPVLTEQGDSSSSDSGESQISGISEIPLNERLKRKRRKHLKRQKKLEGKPSGYISDTPSCQSEVPLMIRMAQRKKRRLLAAQQPEFKVPRGRIMKRANEEFQRLMAQKNKKQKTEKTNEPVATNETTPTEEDDDIEMIEIIPGKKSSDGVHLKTTEHIDKSSAQSKSIHITFNKEKTKSIFQRSCGSLEESSVVEETCKKVPNSSSSKAGFSKNPSTLVPCTVAINTTTPTAVSTLLSPRDLDLDDGSNKWEFKGGLPATSATQKSNASTSLSSPQKEKPREHSELNVLLQDSPKKSMDSTECTSASGSLTDEDKSPLLPKTTTNSSIDAGSDHISRPLRARKQFFDPKVEAVKIKPKPVPKVTKETFQQQQILSSKFSGSQKEKEGEGRPPSRIDSNKPAFSGQNEVFSSSSRRLLQKAENTKKSQSDNQTNKKDEDDIIILSPPKEKTDSQRQLDPDPPKTQSDNQNEATNQSEDATLRRSSRESPSQYHSPQRSSNTDRRIGGETSMPKKTTLTLVDGEVRKLPTPSSPPSSTANTRGSRTESSSSGGTWRRGGTSDPPRRDPNSDYTDDSVDFVTRPGDQGRQGNNRNEGNRNRSGYRGNRPHRGGHHSQYGNHPGYPVRAPHHGAGTYFDGPRGQGPRSQFRGPPPRHYTPPGWGWSRM